MQQSTIPRFELCAAVLLAKWMGRVKEVLSAKVTINQMFAWSDSQIVLAWLLNSHQDFKVFVSNHVHQEQQQLPCCQWRYIRSSMNLADCACYRLIFCVTCFFGLAQIFFVRSKNFGAPCYF